MTSATIALLALAIPLAAWGIWLVTGGDVRQYKQLDPKAGPMQASLFEALLGGAYFIGGFYLLTVSVPLAGVSLYLGGLVLGSALRNVNLFERTTTFITCLLWAVFLGFAAVQIFFSIPLSIVQFFPGSVVAFAFGQVVGMLMRTAVNCVRG